MNAAIGKAQSLTRDASFLYRVGVPIPEPTTGNATIAVWKRFKYIQILLLLL